MIGAIVFDRGYQNFQGVPPRVGVFSLSQVKEKGQGIKIKPHSGITNSPYLKFSQAKDLSPHKTRFQFKLININHPHWGFFRLDPPSRPQGANTKV